MIRSTKSNFTTAIPHGIPPVTEASLIRRVATSKAKYGIGRVVARQKTRDGDVLETLIGYQWTQDTTTLVLYYYTAENGADSYRLLSLHYRGY